MGVNVYLEIEGGKQIVTLLDPHGIICRLLPMGDEHFALLRYVDPYGDTVFNRLQMEQILKELEQLKKSRGRSAEEMEYIRQLEDMARQCQSEPHLYLKFYGD